MTAGATRTLGLLALTVLFALSLAVRSTNIWDRPLLSHNEDATGHVLATLKAMEAAPSSVHKYLPIITLSQRPADRNIDNFAKASVADASGNYFYISFPPMGFAIPALAFHAIGVEPSLLSLRLFCAGLGLLTAGLFYLLALRLLSHTQLRARDQTIAALCIAVLMLLNSESLWVFGNVYWHHVLLEPLLVLTLLLVAQVLERSSALRGVLLTGVLLLACSIEWAAYPLAGGVALLGLYLLIRKQTGGLPLLLAGAMAPVAALLFIFWHFAQAAGLEAYLGALQNRPAEHRLQGLAAVSAAVAFAPVYLPLAAIGVALFRSRQPALPHPSAISAEHRRIYRAVLFCAAAASAEAILLLQHTVKYTYGSLPLTTLLLLALLMLFVWTRASVGRLAIGTAICVVVWLGVYFVQNPPGLAQSEFGRQFDSLDQISAEAAPDEMIFTNLDFPLGVPLARLGRNLVSPPNIAPETPLAQMQAILARGHVSRGKLFLFDKTPRKIPQLVWWPYTKSRVIDMPLRSYGPLAAIVSFDRSGITGIASGRAPESRRVLQAWLAHQPKP